VGYDTDFDGQVTITPPLSVGEVAFLKKFAKTRHCSCQVSPFTANESYICSPAFGRNGGCRGSHLGNPGYYCKWEPSEDGTVVEWGGREKFYDGEEWMRFLINSFLKPGADIFFEDAGAPGDQHVSAAKAVFNLNGHVLNGVIDAQGEESDDQWRLVVKDNVVTVVKPTVTWPIEREPAIVQSYVVAGEIESGDTES
jgi:hypothetical protein